MWHNNGRMSIWKTRFLRPVIAVAALAGAAWLALAQGDHRSYSPAVMRGPISTGSPVVKINFQPEGAAIPHGYLPDTGATYAKRGNDFSYGWNADNSTTTRDRNSPFAFDQRFDTLIHLQKPENPDAIWEIALPPGVYDIYAVAGDPESFDGYMQSLAEGRGLVNGAPHEGRRFINGTAAAVPVSDGRLTIRSGSGAVNNKLSFLEIYKVADLPTPPPDTVEFRGLWVTRFDWSIPLSKADLDKIVDDAARAGFNAILFQVRANGDAYYASGLEPWARRVTGTFGQAPNPYWDPLAYIIDRAHKRGVQVHAYVNVYPIWENCTPPPEDTNPRSPYYLLRDEHGLTGEQLNGAQWQQQGGVYCSDYLYATPASTVYRDHVKAVVADLVQRYAIDGIHLDRVRYAGRTLSCDPVSKAVFDGDCFTGDYPAYEDWQREQVNTLVHEIYNQVIVPAGRNIWLSAAVWHTYQDRWEWGNSQGYSDYYQDSRAWVRDGYIDALMPMIYSSKPPGENPFPFEKWRILAQDFQDNRAGRYAIPGIGGIGEGLLSFDDVVDRIEAARAMGTAGHVIFSYGALRDNDYFDDLAAGPYATPAAVPEITWHD